MGSHVWSGLGLGRGGWALYIEVPCPGAEPGLVGALLVMVTWQPLTDRHDWKHYPPATLLTDGKNKIIRLLLVFREDLSIRGIRATTEQELLILIFIKVLKSIPCTLEHESRHIILHLILPGRSVDLHFVAQHNTHNKINFPIIEKIFLL